MFMVRYVGTSNHRGADLYVTKASARALPAFQRLRGGRVTGTVVKRMVGAMDASLSESEGK